MSEYQNLDLNTLFDLLGKKTSDYTKMVKQEGFSEKTNECRKEIKEIQDAIESKKHTNKN